jgi:hypothetical protein
LKKLFYCTGFERTSCFTDWKLNFNYWTGATRQDFAVGGVKWCPASRSNFTSPSPWGLLGGSENATLSRKLDCVALKVGKTKTNFTISFFGKLLMRNCSGQQMIACRVNILFAICNTLF